MIFAVDVGYRESGAIAAGVCFDAWDAMAPTAELTIAIDQIAEYEPGQFYKRELPCILALLDKLPELPQYIVVDGYVELGRDGKPGLGKHLYEALQRQASVIGVAKTRFHDTPTATEVFRGVSQRPLYVTAIGIELAKAQEFIANMAGENRIPVLLKRVDRLTRR